VPHIRYTRQGAKPLTDPRDIYELIANNGARRLRACILGIIPGDIVDEAVNACDLTLKTKFDVTPDRIKSLLEKFAEYKVTKEQIETRIQCRVDAMKPAQLANLGKIYNSLKDGMSKPDDWFQTQGETAEGENKGAEGAKNAVRDALGLKAVENKGKAKNAAETPSQPSDGQASVESLI
jgi:hypothetical protein